MSDVITCPTCGCEIVVEIGWLGNKYWVRCRYCGLTFSVRNEYGQPLEREDEDDQGE